MTTENTTNKLEMEGLSIKLTEEKLFITTAISTETFGLRSIDGIGVIDLVEKLNQEMIEYKKLMLGTLNAIIIGSSFLLAGLYGIAYVPELGVPTFLLGAGFAGFGFYKRNTYIKPTLKSAVRIMMAGGNRDFTFDKAQANSSDVAEFVAKVEDTLTAFHKK